MEPTLRPTARFVVEGGEQIGLLTVYAQPKGPPIPEKAPEGFKVLSLSVSHVEKSRHGKVAH